MKLQENFKAYSDGELSIAERHLVAKHLETNDTDRKEVEDLRRLSKAIREYVTQSEPAGLEATLAALETAKPRANRQMAFTQQLRWLGWSAAAVLGVGLIGMVFFPVFAQSKESAKKSLYTFQNRSEDSSAGAAPAGLHDSIAKDDLKQGMAKSAVGQNTPDGAHSSPAAAGNAFNGGGMMPEAEAPVAGERSNGKFASGATGTMGATRSAKGNTFDGLSKRVDSVTGVAEGNIPPPQHTRPPLIQKTANLTVKVKSVADAQQAIEGMVAGRGGWIQQSNRNEAEGQAGSATLTLRIPVNQFDAMLKSIRVLGSVVSDSSSGNDVTGDVVDMDARLKVLRAEEADYMILLGRARRTGEIMEIRDKLTEIRTEIESITGQRNVAKDMAAFSTINVTLEQRPIAGEKPKQEGADTWLNDTWATAVNGLTAAGKMVTQLLIFVLVWSPIWVPATLLGAWIYRKTKW